MPLQSRFPDVVIRDESVPNFLLRSLPLYGNAVSMIDTSTGKTYTFRDVIRISRSIAIGLHLKGLNPRNTKGDVIALCTANCADSVLLLLAALQLGAITTGMNPEYTEEEISYHLKDSRAKMVVASKASLSKVKNVFRKIKGTPEMLFVIGLEDTKNSVHPFSALMKTPHNAHKSSKTSCSLWPPISEEEICPRLDVAILPYSSGTTGRPKGVMLTHYNIVAMATLLTPTYFQTVEPGDAVIAALPFYHIFGFLNQIKALINGAKMIVLPKFERHAFLRTIQEYKVKIVSCVPPMFLFLAKSPLVSQYDLSSLESVHVGAAPVSKDLSLEMLRRHKNLNTIGHGYGMTEVSAVSHVCPPERTENIKHGSCGLLLPNYECKLLDVESGKEVEGPFKQGEICLRGPTVMLGYWNNAKETAQTIDEDGWLHTGDIGYYDEDEYFFIVDRIKELIKVNAFQVAPAELEAILLTHSAIAEAAVVGMPDVASGELPHAFVVAREEMKQAPSEDELLEFVNSKVIHYKRLKSIRFLSELPKSASGKLQRRFLREQYANRVKPKL